MKSMEESSYARDAQGNPYVLPLPQRYYELARENKRLLADRAELATKLDQLRAAAKKVQQQMPTPRFTGAQRMIGVEATPLLQPMNPPNPLPREPAVAPLLHALQ